MATVLTNHLSLVWSETWWRGAGWFLFLVFAGVGFVALPMDLVREWWGRPRATIPKSEYLTRAMEMARKAKSVKVCALIADGLSGHGPSEWPGNIPTFAMPFYPFVSAVKGSPVFCAFPPHPCHARLSVRFSCDVEPRILFTCNSQ